MGQDLVVDDTSLKNLEMSEYEIAVGWKGRKEDEKLEQRKVTGFKVAEHLAVRDMENGNGWAIDHLPSGRRLNRWPLLTFQTVVLYAKAVYKFLEEPAEKDAEMVWTEEDRDRMVLYMKFLIVNPESDMDWDQFRKQSLPPSKKKKPLQDLVQNEAEVQRMLEQPSELRDDE